MPIPGILPRAARRISAGDNGRFAAAMTAAIASRRALLRGAGPADDGGVCEVPIMIMITHYHPLRRGQRASREGLRQRVSHDRERTVMIAQGKIHHSAKNAKYA